MYCDDARRNASWAKVEVATVLMNQIIMMMIDHCRFDKRKKVINYHACCCCCCCDLCKKYLAAGIENVDLNSYKCSKLFAL